MNNTSASDRAGSQGLIICISPFLGSALQLQDSSRQKPMWNSHWPRLSHMPTSASINCNSDRADSVTDPSLLPRVEVGSTPVHELRMKERWFSKGKWGAIVKIKENRCSVGENCRCPLQRTRSPNISLHIWRTWGPERLGLV